MCRLLLILFLFILGGCDTDKRRILSVVSTEFTVFKEVEKKQIWSEFSGDGFKAVKYYIEPSVNPTSANCQALNMEFDLLSDIGLQISFFDQEILRKGKVCSFKEIQENSWEVIVLQGNKLLYFYEIR